MSDVTSIWSAFTGSFTSVFQFIYDWIKAASECGVSPSPWIIAAICFSLIIYFASGFIAATMAEEKGRSPGIHFIGGLVLPYIYPFLIVPFLSATFGKKEEEKSEEPPKPHRIPLKKHVYQPQPNNGQVAEGAVPKSETIKLDAETPLKEEIESPEVAVIEAGDVEENNRPKEPGQFNMDYFGRLSVRLDGSANGPFKLELLDGKLLDIAKIASPMEQVVVLEIPGGIGKPNRTLRVPYAKIKSFTLVEHH